MQHSRRNSRPTHRPGSIRLRACARRPEPEEILGAEESDILSQSDRRSRFQARPPRISRLMAPAIRFAGLLRKGAVKDYSDWPACAAFPSAIRERRLLLAGLARFPWFAAVHGDDWSRRRIELRHLAVEIKGQPSPPDANDHLLMPLRDRIGSGRRGR